METQARQGRLVTQQALWRFLWAAQLNFDFDADELLIAVNCKLCANYLQLVFKLCAISEQIVCKHTHTESKITFCCTSRVAFMAKTGMPSPLYCASVHKTSILYKCTQHQFNVQLYTKPVYCTSVHKTSLWYKCTQNQFTVKVYTKLVHHASVHKISLLYNFTQN